MTEDGGTIPEEVGTVAEEAAKLFDALQGWAREASGGAAAGPGEQPPSGSGEPTGEAYGEPAGEPWPGVRAHLTDGGQECTWCPLCRAVALVRQTSPEVRDHLLDAAGSLLAAGAALLEGRAAGPGGRGAGPRGHQGPAPDLEHIDLDEGGGDAAGWDAD